MIVIVIVDVTDSLASTVHDEYSWCLLDQCGD